MTTIYNLFKNQNQSDELKIKNNYDNVFDNNNNYHQIYTDLKKNFIDKNKTYINFSNDKSVSSSTIAAINELYAYRFGQIFKSDLKIIYISDNCDLHLNDYDDISKINYQNSVISNLLSISIDEIKRSYTKHLIDCELEQFIFCGLQNISDVDESLLIKAKCKYYNLNILNKKLQNIIENIVEENKDKPVAIIFDINSLSPKIIGKNTDKNTDTNTNKFGFNIDQINMMLKIFSNLDIKMIDIVGYTNESNLKSRLLINKIYLNLLKQENIKVNIFDEESRFLIFKPLDEIYDNNGYDNGWYILRNVNNSMKRELLESLEPDSIIMLEIPDDDKDDDVEIMITSTNINEQNEKCYYYSKDYKDCCLYPDEKLSMCFELVNSV